jgi:hypothetical protein
LICEGCGVVAPALKTVRWRSGERRFVLCDPCWGPMRGAMWVVPGDFTVTARCDACGAYLNPRELVPETRRPGGGYKRDVIASGLCRGCAR